MSTFGKAIEINLFGESHGQAIGIIINNLPAGIHLDQENIKNELTKRRPKGNISTPRQEKDPYQIVSGYFNEKTTGTPLTILIPNGDTRSKDYKQNILRPSHADFTSHIKYDNSQDYRGSGHFSGRITAPIVILGAICSQILNSKGINIVSHISSIKDKKDINFDEVPVDLNLVKSLINSDFPTIKSENEALFKSVILAAKEEKDSVGGTIETMVLGLNAGYGDPFFESVESVLAHLLFSIPAIKGVEFGRGFDITTLNGSEANDSFIIKNNQIKTNSNNSGGIQGGISNGMPIIFKTAVKPTASIGKLQHTVDIKSMKEVTMELEGRHDPCIVHRVIHVINAMTNYAILELIVRNEGLKWIK